MKRSTVVLSFLALILTLGLVGPAFAAELPAPISFEEQLLTQAVPPEAVPADGEPISLETLEALFGAEKVCGALCSNTPPRRTCTFLCGNGEPAQCVFGRCVWS